MPQERHRASEFQSGHRRNEVAALLAEIARRQAESLRLYDPLPAAEQFHSCTARERLARGSNRSAKTLTAAVELARACTGQDPFNKYPLVNGRAFIVAKDGKEIGQVIYRKCFRAGAFFIIRDLETGLWRTYRPWTDAGRISQRKPAPPLIPPRFVKSVAWENKAAMIPNIITLVNGWELSFFSSNAAPPTGSDIDLCWFDEEILFPEWYPEMMARLVDRRGKFFWSATPQAATENLYALHERAEKEESNPVAKVREFVFLLEDNPYIGAEEKRELWDSYTDEQRRVRYYGEYARTSLRVYPEFADYVHGVDWFAIPPDWSNYMVVDPGRQVCAVLFGAVPPDNKHCYLWDELYLEDCDAHVFGKAASEVGAGRAFQAFLIDSHAGRVNEMGSGLNIEQQYSLALKEYGFQSAMGYGFVWGSDDVKAGILKVRSWLRIQPDGLPYVLVLRDKCDKFRWEIKRYHYKRNRDGELSEEPERRHSHLMDDLRYLAMYDPKWIKPPEPKKAEGYAVRSLRLKRQWERQREGGSLHIRLGPGA